MAQSKHLGTAKIAGDEIRFVLDTHGRAGCYRPILLVFRRGPNGSPAGVGPKGWPWWLHRERLGGGEKRRWSNTIRVPLPHVSFATGYRLRRVGGLRAYKAISRAYRAAVA